MRNNKWSTALGMTALAVFAAASAVKGYVLYGHKWATSEVVYYINPTNIYMSEAAASEAIKSAAAAWSTQTNASVSLVFGGYTTASTAAYDGKNNVFFRNDAGGGYTYTWYSNSTGMLVEADTILYEASRPMFSGTTGCSSGIYVEDLATHEFGHVLGLQHSGDPSATMYPTTNYCDTTWRTLAEDDIAGIEAIYPPAARTQAPAAPSNLSGGPGSGNPTGSVALAWRDNASNESGYRIERSVDGASFTQVGQVGSNTAAYTDAGLTAGATYYYRVAAYNSGGTSYSNVALAQTQSVANTPPVVTIANPVGGAQYPATSVITFSGTAVDGQDGNISSRLQWTSSIDGTIGSGASFSRALSAGTHTIRAEAMDGSNATGWQQVSMTVSSNSGQVAPPPSLSARGYLVKNSPKVDLTWSGATGGSVDIYRNGALIRSTSNDGKETDSLSAKRISTYTYKVCNSGTSICSNDASVSF